MRIVPIAITVLFATTAFAQVGELDARLEDVDRSLYVENSETRTRVDLSVQADLEGWLVDERPPGLVFGGDGLFVNPRLTAFLDARAGRWLYAFVQARADRGFDPRLEPDGDARFDEYFLRVSPFADPRLRVQFGKSATVIGNWVLRHDSWTNPFVNAPVPYERVTAISDDSAPADADAFLARRSIPDRKDVWVPVLWGPVYATGGTVSGSLGDFDYAAEVKNAAPSSRPGVWDGRSRGFGDPTVGGRLGWRPGAPWAIGVSAARGAYLREEARATLPAGADTDDFDQTLVGVDARWAWRHLELWAEGFLSRFEVPNVGDADTAAWYVEGRYGITRGLWAGLRFNQQLFDEVRDGAGGEIAWDRDLWRIDAALTHRFGRHLQAKAQYGYGRQTGELQQGEQLVALQLTVKF